MITLDDLFADVDDAFEDLRSSGEDETAQRRAGRAVLGALFEMREEFRISQGGAYWTEVERGIHGKVAEGILVIRGRMTHGPLNEIRPAVKLADPGPKFFPSNYTYPGSNLTWLELDDMPTADRAELERRDNRMRYADHVAGHMVLPTLDIARQFYRRLTP